jgi:hypothetical protein
MDMRLHRGLTGTYSNDRVFSTLGSMIRLTGVRLPATFHGAPLGRSGTLPPDLLFSRQRGDREQ